MSSPVVFKEIADTYEKLSWLLFICVNMFISLFKMLFQWPSLPTSIKPSVSKGLILSWLIIKFSTQTLRKKSNLQSTDKFIVFLISIWNIRTLSKYTRGFLLSFSYWTLKGSVNLWISMIYLVRFNLLSSLYMRAAHLSPIIFEWSLIPSCQSFLHCFFVAVMAWDTIIFWLSLELLVILQ